MKKLATIVFCMLSFWITSSAQTPNEIKLANYKMKINNLQVESVEVVLSKEIELSFWNNELIEHLEQGIFTASKKKNKSALTLHNFLVYFSELDIELNPNFKDYGKATGIFYFYSKEGEKLIKIKSVRAEVETKMKYMPRLLLEKAIGDIGIEEIEQSLRLPSKIKSWHEEISKINEPFRFNFETQKPGVYLFFEDLKSNEPRRALSEEELVNIIPDKNYLSIYMDFGLDDKKMQASSILSNYWGIFTGKEYLALIDNVLVKLHQKDSNIVFPAYALELEVVSNSPSTLPLSLVGNVLLQGPIGLLDAGNEAILALWRINKPSLEKKLYILNKKNGHFNYVFKEEE